MTATEKETYLGDGLYVSLSGLDGFRIKLRAPRIGGDHVIYMEGGELAAFMAYLKNTGLSAGILR